MSGAGASDHPQVSLRRYAAADLPLLERLLGDPAMMTHLGGPESQAQLRARHLRYLADGSSGLYTVVLGPEQAAVGWVGYWDRDWRGEQAWECGWNVLPEYQRRGIATAAVGQLIQAARADGRRAVLHAFPAVDNVPSNALCRRLGFILLGAVDFEYPPGHPMRCNDWRLDLAAA